MHFLFLHFSLYHIWNKEEQELHEVWNFPIEKFCNIGAKNVENKVFYFFFWIVWIMENSTKKKELSNKIIWYQIWILVELHLKDILKVLLLVGVEFLCYETCI